MLKFIGTGSAFNAELGNTSAYIKNDKTVFVFDCGETAFARMKQIKLFEDVENVYVFITHTHSDHIGSLGSLIHYLNLCKGVIANIIVSTDEEAANNQMKVIKNLLQTFGCGEEAYEFTYVDMLEDVLPNLKEVKMTEVKHSDNLKSYAIELYFNDRTIYFVGDNHDKTYLKHIAKKLKENDVVYTDCTNLVYKNSPHISIGELCEIFDEKQRKQVYTMHFNSNDCVQDAKNAGFMVASRENSKEEILKQIVSRY